MSFNFMPAATICSDFGAQKNKSDGEGNGRDVQKGGDICITMAVPWTARRSKQSILKEINTGISLEGIMLKLKPPVLWPPDAKS